MANHHARLANLRQAQIEEAARNTDAEDLKRLASSADVMVRVAVAANPNAGAEVLRRLAADESWRVRAGVLANPNAEVALIRKVLTGLPVMAVEEAPVRRILEQKQVAPEIFEVLAGGRVEVRLLLAKDERTPEAVLDELGRHRNIEIRKAVAANPGAGEATLARLAGDREDQVREAQLHNPKASLELLAREAQSYDTGNKWLVAQHPKTPPAILEEMLVDWGVSGQVIDVLAKKAETNPRLKFGLRVRKQYRGDPGGLKALLDTLFDTAEEKVDPAEAAA